MNELIDKLKMNELNSDWIKLFEKIVIGYEFDSKTSGPYFVSELVQHLKVRQKIKTHNNLACIGHADLLSNVNIIEDKDEVVSGYFFDKTGFSMSLYVRESNNTVLGIIIVVVDEEKRRLAGQEIFDE